MHQLNLPAFPYKLKHSPENTLIFDAIRRKYLVLTQEEWVRQHFINYLIAHLHYPKGLLAIERGTTYNNLAKRTDICIYDTNRKPLLLVECKASTVKITAETVKQATVYNKKLGATYLILTNGLEHYCWQIKDKSNIPLAQIPDYSEISLPNFS